MTMNAAAAPQAPPKNVDMPHCPSNCPGRQSESRPHVLKPSQLPAAMPYTTASWRTVVASVCLIEDECSCITHFGTAAALARALDDALRHVRPRLGAEVRGRLDRSANQPFLVDGHQRRLTARCEPLRQFHRTLGGCDRSRA